MIRFRPECESLSLSLRGEQVFDSMEEMLQHVHETWSRVSCFLGSEPLRPDEIVIADESEIDRRIGWKNVRSISIRRMIDTVYSVPMCIGYCGE